MRLFHISEEPDITQFVPRLPARKDLDPSKGLVWAINEQCLSNFFTPRECPRVTYHVDENTSEEDIARFFSSRSRRCVTIEQAWFERMRTTALYIYEFDPANFYLQDACAGYYVSEYSETPIGETRIDDCFGALFERNIEVRLIDNLWDFADAVKTSTLRYSICDFALAMPRKLGNQD